MIFIYLVAMRVIFLWLALEAMTFIFDGQHLDARKTFLFDNICYNCSHDWRTTFSNHDNLFWQTTFRSHEV